jgi:hypothetical protein
MDGNGFLDKEELFNAAKNSTQLKVYLNEFILFLINLINIFIGVISRKL